MMNSLIVMSSCERGAVLRSLKDMEPLTYQVFRRGGTQSPYLEVKPLSCIILNHHFC